MQRNSNNYSIARNTSLHFQKLENKIFKVTYSTILNKKSVNTRYKKEINFVETVLYFQY